MDLKGNTILITGGTSGIGLAFAKALTKENKVIVTGRRKNRLETIKNENKGIDIRQMDVTNETERTSLMEWLSQNHPETNVFINNAGIQRSIDLKEPGNLEEIYSEINTNYIAQVHLSTLFSSYFLNRKEGTLINITSGLAFTPLAEKAVYCSTKAAMHSFTLSLRFQLKDTPVKVFEIAPPSVDTELGHQDRNNPDESHGGMAVAEFIKKSLEALKNDRYETAIGIAANLKEERENFMEKLNDRD